MKLAYFTDSRGLRVAIPVDRITGFCQSNCGIGETFIATGADGLDGAENGWYVVEKFETVKIILSTI